ILHRFVWAGLLFLPLVARAGLGNLGGIGWPKGLLLTLAGGPTLSFFSYAGFLFVPLAHGGVLQPSCPALGWLPLATFLLRETRHEPRAIGACTIGVGLLVIAREALASTGTHGLAGDLSFATAGLMFTTFASLLRLWGIPPIRAVAVTRVISLSYLPVYWLFF